jgi:hypothetical protein
VETTGNTILPTAKESGTTIHTLAPGSATIPFVAEVKIGWTSAAEAEIRSFGPTVVTGLEPVSDPEAATGPAPGSDLEPGAATGPVLVNDREAVTDLEPVSGREAATDRAQGNGLQVDVPARDSGLPAHAAAATPLGTSDPAGSLTGSPGAGTRASAVVAAAISASVVAAVSAAEVVVASAAAAVAVSAVVAVAASAAAGGAEGAAGAQTSH